MSFLKRRQRRFEKLDSRALLSVNLGLNFGWLSTSEPCDSVAEFSSEFSPGSTSSEIIYVTGTGSVDASPIPYFGTIDELPIPIPDIGPIY